MRTDARGSLLAVRPTSRLELSSALWSAGEAVYLVGVIVYAFGVGGPSAVALVAVLQSLPSAVLAPVAMAVTHRIPRASLLTGTVAVRAATAGLVALTVAIAGPAAAVFALAAIDGLAAALLRPVRGALVPMLARSPEELVSANVAIAAGMSGAALVGPALAAAVLAVGSVEATFALGGLVFGAAVVAASRLGPVADHAGDLALPGRRGRGSFAVLARNPAARTVIAVIVAQRFVRGMLTVLIATTALDLLRAGEEGVGILNAAIGLGGVAGSVLAMRLAGRARLAGAFAAAIATWGVAVAIPSVVPLLGLAVLLLAVGGAGKAILEVAGTSLVQRTVPSAGRTVVLALLESFVTAALAAGAVTASLLVDGIGAGPALLAAGGLTVTVTAVSWPSLRRVDDAAAIPARELRLLRSVGFFRPLQLTTIEDLAGRLTDLGVPAGSEVVRQGEPGDRFYIVESGSLETLIDGRRVGALGPGDSFGEIALLRDVPRTATVRAVTDASLVLLARDDFLRAVTGHVESASAAEAVVRSRVSAAGPPPG